MFPRVARQRTLCPPSDLRNGQLASRSTVKVFWRLDGVVDLVAPLQIGRFNMRRVQFGNGCI